MISDLQPESLPLDIGNRSGFEISNHIAEAVNAQNFAMPPVRPDSFGPHISDLDDAVQFRPDIFRS